MNIMREREKVAPIKWSRYKYNLTTNLGENGERLTSCKEHIELSRKTAVEGMVLLENNGVLPLKEGTTVALFGIGTLDYVKGGGGSGMVFSEYVRNIYEGFSLKTPKIKVYEPVTKFYYDYALSIMEDYKAGEEFFLDVKLLPEAELPSELIEKAKNNADVAIITIHRFSGEGWDRSSEKGDFYLTDEEQKMVDDVTKAFSKCVVVLDVGGMIDVSWIKNNPKIDAALLAWQAGMEGGLAIADIICGDVNPSGKLTDTFAKEFTDYPSADTFNESKDYVCYFEDIYVGYRYFETVPGVADKVNYPFGFGLSYTEFDISKPIAALVDGKINITTTVKNIGSMAGKEVVQVYFSAPQGVLGKPKISLAGFKKTDLLKPNEGEKITIEFDVSDMASYDDLGKLQISAYLLEKGEYTFYVGNSCRNLTAAEYKYVVKEEFIVTEQLSQKCAPNKLARRMLSDGSFEELPSFPVKKYSDVSVVPNNDKISDGEKMIDFTQVADGKVSLDKFVSQFTEDELISIVSGVPCRGMANTCGFGGIERLGVPAVMTVDGPAGVRLDPTTGIATTAWPCATLIACTWNTELMYEIGRAGGLEAKENGLAVWLTPALNIHRNPLCGRNFEYFSEDPLISGKFAAAKVNGIQSVKTAASAKHFACNNKEVNRKFSDSRVSERALREIYLRGFEICVKESQPWTVMSSYNLINDRRCCTSYEQLQGILRDEWGFKGMVTSDWDTPCDQTYCVLSGNDLRMPTGDPQKLKESLENKCIKREHLENVVKHILEMILKLD